MRFWASFKCPLFLLQAIPRCCSRVPSPEPTFLIAKPFNAETVKAVIGQALFFEVRSHRKSPVPKGNAV